MNRSNRRKWFIGIFILLVGIGFASSMAAQDTIPLDELLTNVTFRPVEEIMTGDLVVTNFANDGTATLPITTTVPVACSIVYGTTPEFGSLAVDLDMAGGTHTEHSPLLLDLESETTYYFRVQGTDDFGVIYLSEVMTFTTPPRKTVENTNLASPELGAEITGYSSAFGGADLTERWGALSAVDGSSNSAWSSAGDGDDAWLEIRLAQRSQINRIEYWSRAMSDGTSQVFEFTITTDDGRIYGPFSLDDADQSYSFEVDFQTTTLRFDVVSSSGGNTGAVEFGVYGEPLDE
ncbi:discoidin domain-containing protein [Anaerolineae bacterium CFX8]|nr:discoidin domain-containing protein [Anaerolineae bacterium CFX8]